MQNYIVIWIYGYVHTYNYNILIHTYIQKSKIALIFKVSWWAQQYYVQRKKHVQIYTQTHKHIHTHKCVHTHIHMVHIHTSTHIHRYVHTCSQDPVIFVKLLALSQSQHYAQCHRHHKPSLSDQLSWPKSC